MKMLRLDSLHLDFQIGTSNNFAFFYAKHINFFTPIFTMPIQILKLHFRA
ncbi:MAG: hypothetical protein RL065_1933 [Bacteroidota bacterium]|jgi:hypothetical protein